MSHCTYHPLRAAKQHCIECDTNYCYACCNEGDDSTARREEFSYSCFICESSLIAIEIEDDTIPFWRNFNQIYRYPSSSAAIAVIVVCSLVYAVIPWFLAIIPLIAIMHYCFACLRNTAAGNMQAPTFENCFEGSVAPFLYLVILYLIAIFTISIITVLLGNAIGILFGLFCLLVLPAAIIILCIEEKLTPALNPSKLITIISSTGTSYFVAYLFLLLMTSSLYALKFAVGSNGSLFNDILQGAISNYYFIVIFHILGYLVHQNHNKLGYGIKTTEPKTVRDRHERLNANIEIQIKTGDYTKAIELSSQQIKSGTASLLQWQRCLKLLLVDGSDANIKKFAEHYFDKLEKDRQFDSLADDYVNIKRRVKSFELKKAVRKLKVANSLMEVGKYKYVVLLLRNFTSDCKDKTHISQSLKLLSQAYAKLPGQEKNAMLYKKQFQLIQKLSNV